MSISIEKYANGFIVAKYGPGDDVMFYGQSMNGRTQPFVSDPFESEEEAHAAAAHLNDLTNEPESGADGGLP